MPLAGNVSEPGVTASVWPASSGGPGESFARTSIVSGASSLAATASSAATGGSFAGVTVTVTVAVAQSGGAPLSQTW